MSHLAHLPDLMADQLLISRSEARRVIAQGGVRKDGEPITDLDVPADGTTLTVGTRRQVTIPDQT